LTYIISYFDTLIVHTTGTNHLKILKCLFRPLTSQVIHFKSKVSDGRQMDTETFRTRWTTIPVRWTSQNRIWQGTGMKIAQDHARKRSCTLAVFIQCIWFLIVQRQLL